MIRNAPSCCTIRQFMPSPGSRFPSDPPINPIRSGRSGLTWSRPQTKRATKSFRPGDPASDTGRCTRLRDASTQPAPPTCSLQAPRNGHSSDLQQEHIEELGAITQSRTLLDYSFGPSLSLTRSHGPRVSHYNPAFAAPPPAACEAADEVVCTDTLDFLPDEDVPWMLEELFRHARHFVSVSVSTVPYERRLSNGAHLQS